MKSRLVVAGLLLILLAQTPNSAAYHVNGVPTGLGISARTWTNPGTGTVGVVVCESDGPTDPVNDLPESQGGGGGLCFAGSGYATPAVAPSATVWGKVTPFFTDPGLGIIGPGFLIRIGNNQHSCIGAIGVAASDDFTYQELFAYWFTNGHVTFIIDEPFTAGSYGGTTGLSNPGTGYCDASNRYALG